MALYSNIFNFSHLFQFDEFSLDLSIITKLEILDSFNSFILDAFFNLLIIDALVELNIYGFLGAIIGGFLLITVILIIGPRVLESKPINEGIKTVINLGVAALTGIALANASNGRDDDERKRREEEEKKRREEEAKNAKKSWW